MTGKKPARLLIQEIMPSAEKVQKELANVVIVPIADIHRGSLRAIQYARRLSDDVRAITIATTPEDKQQFLKR